MDSAVPAENWVEIKESKKRDKCLDFARELKKKETMEYEGEGDTNCDWCTCNNPQRISKGTKGLKNKRTSEDHSDYSIIKIGKNTEKSPGDLRRLAATQNLVKNIG